MAFIYKEVSLNHVIFHMKYLKFIIPKYSLTLETTRQSIIQFSTRTINSFYPLNHRIHIKKIIL